LADRFSQVVRVYELAVRIISALQPVIVCKWHSSRLNEVKNQENFSNNSAAVFLLLACAAALKNILYAL
jgi:hypothetical protein